MPEERDQGGTTESTERIPPGSMPPDDHSGSGPTDDSATAPVSDLPEDPSEDEKADKESADSFPASDPPAW